MRAISADLASTSKKPPVLGHARGQIRQELLLLAVQHLLPFYGTG
jgi:hypothetical protein